MADEPDDLGIPMKPARPPGQAATVAPLNRAPAPVPARAPDLPRPAEGPRPVEAAARPAGAPMAPQMAPQMAPPMAPAGALSVAPRRTDAEARKLIVGREISLSGEITSCDKLIVEGSVEANLQNCQDVDIAESGLFKGSATIEEAEVRGRFEGNLVVRKRLFIRATGRVSGTIRYGQIEIECGGQISGDIQTHSGEDFVADMTGARVAF